MIETAGLVVADSTSIEHELGVLAKRDYMAGEVVCMVKGPVQPKPSKYSFSIGIDRHIEPQSQNGEPDFGRYMNHSCDPTAFVRVVCREGHAPFIEVVARKVLKAGQELTFDYASLEYEVTVRGMECKCGASTCRGTIHGFKDLPQHIVDRYKKEGLIPDHLLSIEPPTNVAKAVSS